MGTPAVVSAKGPVLGGLLSPGHVRGSVQKLLVSIVSLILAGLQAKKMFIFKF